MNALGSFVEERMRRLGLAPADVVARLGYRNRAKGDRRVASLLEGDVAFAERRVPDLARALETEASAVAEAIAAARAQALADRAAAEAAEEAAWRASFAPHAIRVTERSVPQPIFVAALLGVDRLLRIDFADPDRPERFLEEALAALPETVPAFGAVTGVAINFSLARCEIFDRAGRRLETRTAPYRVGRARLRLARG